MYSSDANTTWAWKNVQGCWSKWPIVWCQQCWPLKRFHCKCPPPPPLPPPLPNAKRIVLKCRLSGSQRPRRLSNVTKASEFPFPCRQCSSFSSSTHSKRSEYLWHVQPRTQAHALSIRPFNQQSGVSATWNMLASGSCLWHAIRIDHV